MFTDRADAGRRLAMLESIRNLRGDDTVILGLTRGGVPVAYQVAKSLGAPLDIMVVRKLGLPSQPEIAMGAIGENGFEVLDRELISRTGVTPDEVNAVRERERAALDAQLERLRLGRPRLDLNGRVAVIVDDGIATGASAWVACDVARHLGASRIVVAVPVAAPQSLAAIPADEVACVAAPEDFTAVGYHYRDFRPTSEEEVTALLRDLRPSVGPS